MKAVKFLMPHTVGALYNEGEIAGFDDDVADDLIERKIAEAVKAKSSGKPNTADQARADLEAKSDEEIAKLIADGKITVAADADKAAKIAAILAASKGK